MMTQKARNACPSFHERREQHKISLEKVLTAMSGELSPDALKQFDETGYGETLLIDEALAALSHLTGTLYTRETIGGLRFIISADGKLPAPDAKRHFRTLPERPTILQLRDYYGLSLYKLLEAADVDYRSLYRMINNVKVKRADVEAVLEVISRFTGVEYTLAKVNAAVMGREEESG